MDNIDEHEAKQLPPKRGGTRGPTQLHDLVRMQAQGRQLDVTFDENIIPIDRDGPHFINFFGMLVQSQVPVDIREWPQVPREMKDWLWVESWKVII